MKLQAVAGAILLLASSLAWAQAPVMQIQPLQVKPVQPAAASTQMTPSQLQLQTEEAVLKRRIAELERENARLAQEKAALEKRVHDFTSLGGSEVHAYCSADTVSANTAGESRNCGAFSCDRVTGQCMTSCKEASDCLGVGANCNAGQCIFGSPPEED